MSPWGINVSRLGVRAWSFGRRQAMNRVYSNRHFLRLLAGTSIAAPRRPLDPRAAIETAGAGLPFSSPRRMP